MPNAPRLWAAAAMHGRGEPRVHYAHVDTTWTYMHDVATPVLLPPRSSLMSEDGLDDELIALVGEDASGPPEAERLHGSAKDKRSALLTDLSDDEDAEGEPEEEDDDDTAHANPYPLEGIYKDEADREWLLSLNELEREDVLSQRRDELSRKQQQAQLAAMVRSQQAAAGQTRRSSKKKMTEAQKAKRRRSDVRRELEDLDDPFAEDESEEEDVFRESDDEEEEGEPRLRRRPTPSSTKADKLSELRRKRAERAHGRATRTERDDVDGEAPPARRRRRAYNSDDEYESESDYEPAYTSTSRRMRTEEAPILAATSTEPPTLDMLNSVRLGRDELERLLFMPNGADLVRGCFVRCSWGTREGRDGSKEHIYRVHQILNVQERDNKYYDVSHDRSGRWMNSYVTFKWGGKEHHVDVRPLSTQRISESERQRWIAAAGPDAKYPSPEAFQAKQMQLESVLSVPLTEDDIKKMLERKRELRAAAQSLGLDVMAGAQAKRDTANEASALGHMPRFDEHAMAQINERNRRLDRERIQEAERRAAHAKRAALTPAQDKNKEAIVAAALTETTATPVATALASAPSGTAVVPTMDVDLGDF